MNVASIIKILQSVTIINCIIIQMILLQNCNLQLNKKKQKKNIKFNIQMEESFVMECVFQMKDLILMAQSKRNVNDLPNYEKHKLCR